MKISAKSAISGVITASVLALGGIGLGAASPAQALVRGGHVYGPFSSAAACNKARANFYDGRLTADEVDLSGCYKHPSGSIEAYYYEEQSTLFRD